MLSPKVSVIIPSYNAEKFITESIMSVVAQDYENIEIVVCDDCSPDSTKAVVASLLGQYPEKIKFIANETNLGVTRNCNVALSQCTGKYIAFHAGDDVMLPGKIRRQVTYMEEHSRCTICYHNVEVFQSSTNRRLYLYNSWRNPPRTGDVKAAIKFGCFNSGCATMIRRDKLPPEGYDEKFSVASDWHMWIRALLNGGTIDYINETLSRYRRHDNNITAAHNASSKQALLDSLNVTNWVLVNYPKYMSEAMHSFAISLRALRRLDNGRFYMRALCLSLRTKFTLPALGALLLNIASIGRIKI